MLRLLRVGLRQGSGACLDQMTSPSSVYWHNTGRDYEDDDFQVRLLSKAVQLCYVRVRLVSLRYTTLRYHSDSSICLQSAFLVFALHLFSPSFDHYNMFLFKTTHRSSPRRQLLDCWLSGRMLGLFCGFLFLISFCRATLGPCIALPVIVRCSSVRVSVTFVYCIAMSKHILKLFHLLVTRFKSNISETVQCDTNRNFLVHSPYSTV